MGVFRSEESAKKVLSRLENPSADKFVPIIGNVGKFPLKINHNDSINYI